MDSFNNEVMLRLSCQCQDDRTNNIISHSKNGKQSFRSVNLFKILVTNYCFNSKLVYVIYLYNCICKSYQSLHILNAKSIAKSKLIKNQPFRTPFQVSIFQVCTTTVDKYLCQSQKQVYLILIVNSCCILLFNLFGEKLKKFIIIQLKPNFNCMVQNVKQTIIYWMHQCINPQHHQNKNWLVSDKSFLNSFRER